MSLLAVYKYIALYFYVNLLNYCKAFCVTLNKTKFEKICKLQYVDVKLLAIFIAIIFSVEPIILMFAGLYRNLRGVHTNLHFVNFSDHVKFALNSNRFEKLEYDHVTVVIHLTKLPEKTRKFF